MNVKQKPKRVGGGKAVNLYLQDTDMERVSKLADYVATHGHSMGVSASRIIKAALRSVSPNSEFLDVYVKAITDDQRTKAKRAKTGGNR